MNKISFLSRLLLFASFLSAFSLSAQIVSELQTRKIWKDSVVSFRNDFSGARLNDLRIIDDKKYLAIIRPEFTPINPSSYYAFELELDNERELEINFFIDYANSDLKQLKPSIPWLSVDDGLTYSKAQPESWSFNGVVGTLKYKFQKGKTLIAAHNPFTLEDVNSWIRKVEKYNFVSSTVLGISMEGRPLKMLTIGTGKFLKQYVLLMGGQHPPEATGDKGLMYFVQEICSDNPLAKAFREKFQVLVLPMVNPDGKYHGQWRANLAGSDPNRDWLNLTLCENSIISSYFTNQIVRSNRKCLIGIDFHSTYKGLFYKSNFDIQDSTSLANSYVALLKDLDDKVPAPVYPSANRGTSLDFINKTLEASALTREFGYSDTDEMIAYRSRKEAQLLMDYLLKTY